MKLNLSASLGALSLILTSPLMALAKDQTPLVYESADEFYATGDFDGDGRSDIVIVDKLSGKYRLGYQMADGTFSWPDCRYSGTKGLTGFSLGKLFSPKQDGFAFAAPDANQLTVVEAADPAAPGRPAVIPFAAGLGPGFVVAIDVGGDGNTPLADLYVGSVYNSPNPYQASLLRNDGAQFPSVFDAELAGQPTHGNHLSFSGNGAELLCRLDTATAGDTLRLEDLSSGKLVVAATSAALPAHSDYAVGDFAGNGLPEFVTYKPSETSVTVVPATTANGKTQLGTPVKFDLGQPLLRIFTLSTDAKPRLLALFGDGATAGVFDFDGSKAPAPVQTIKCTNGVFSAVASLPKGLMLFSRAADGKFSTKYQIYTESGGNYNPGAYGTLPTLNDNDNITIPDIYARIIAADTVTNASDMKLYTNTIPGTEVHYVMVPIPGGEFTMGSPETEKGRKPDEGPQHKVKIDPFWMEQCEITWNEYELFMYPDEEHRTRATMHSDEAGDKLADAVTHPSKPYVEMSFGMGKDGFPAIAMTHHAANKYCQWLSAKTGQFYRLPTEAEWEYACRAGTTTAYFFGDDPSLLPQYGWFEDNSDFKYQKVGKKKPNPWGLYDMCGNVLEWVLDQYSPDYYAACQAKGVVVEPWNKATKPYPHSVRGGSWNDPAVACRSAARRGSDRTWKMQDPQLPKSIWYFSDAQWVGFRIIRPLKVPTALEMQKYWTSGTERD